MRAFLALAEHLHFRDAAAVLGMSQPALSGAVAALEHALNTRLVERTTRKVLLTPAGERVARRAESVLAELDRLVDEVHAARGPLVGPLRLGVIPTVAPYLLPAVLPRLARDFPELELSVREQQTDHLVTELLAGRLDAVLLALPVTASGVVELPLYEEDFLLVAPSAQPIGPAPVPRRVLGELEVILLNEGHCLRDQALDVCREAGGRATAATYAAGLATLVQLVSGGLGVTLLPQTALPVETRRADGVAVYRFADPAPGRRIGLVHRATSPRAAEFEVLARSVRAAVAEAHPKVRIYS
ncbi:LysR family transcriptional regulator, hydrogen peroxide-inducible genes activator [Thermomonospora echinospora]|uniref:Probable hydrogen peroxide-inducible genes activator n=1 Tax=Thermomonospora echinospora TaxID=1992 RepID=A0A1H5ZD03_9ACTN|nr:hydrogen peroxide-inducible genes activator [Thermomonospora echinospora]SEG34278.1 LysR family transcriptional regulator, hydrogen peroxide-inducible genes activator [Thermomonospora echinospora]